MSNGAGGRSNRKGPTSEAASLNARLRHVGILYVDLPRLRACLAATPAAEYLHAMPPVSTLAVLEPCLARVHAWCHDALAHAALQVAGWRVTRRDDLDALQPGDLRAFEFAMRTLRVGYWGAQDRRHGELYRKAGGVHLRLLIDPNWVIGDHAYAVFGKSYARLCGFFAVEEVVANEGIVVGRPVVVAEPATWFAEATVPERVHTLCRVVGAK